MKILVLTNLFPTPWDPLRGAFNRQQFERLVALHDVEVLTAVDFRQRMTRAPCDTGVAGVKVDYFTFVYLPGALRSLHAVFLWMSLMLQRRGHLRAGAYDCVLASWAYPDAVAARRVARWLRIPYLIKVHGSDLNVQTGFALRRWQIRRALRDASAVLAVSAALGEKARAIGAPADRVHVLYNGVDGMLFHPAPAAAARARLGLDPAAPLVLFVGNLKASKGCLDLLEAFPALLRERPQARLVYVGAGPAAAALRARVEALGCTAQVGLVGAVKHVGLADWFRAADVLCLPSHNEGVPNVVLEAMACGTPVVSTRVGGIPEILPGEAGLLVPVADRGALSAALARALCRSWDKDVIARHAATFRWEDNVTRLAAILQAVVDENTAATGTPP